MEEKICATPGCDKPVRTFQKVCKKPGCGKKFESNARHTAYCCDDCRKSHFKSKVKRRKEYRADTDFHKLKSTAHRLAVMVMDSLVKAGGVNKVCIEEGCECVELLEVHHKNRDFLDNRGVNLEFRCKAHHATAHSALDKVDKENAPRLEVKIG